uniref:Uncharacterized protein n=1 Tax=viral metagenome TaxID=1070528 RepID=A0A2V0RLI1_9ZZZZ
MSKVTTPEVMSNEWQIKSSKSKSSSKKKNKTKSSGKKKSGKKANGGAGSVGKKSIDDEVVDISNLTPLLLEEAWEEDLSTQAVNAKKWHDYILKTKKIIGFENSCIMIDDDSLICKGPDLVRKLRSNSLVGMDFEIFAEDLAAIGIDCVSFFPNMLKNNFSFGDRTLVLDFIDDVDGTKYVVEGTDIVLESSVDEKGNVCNVLAKTISPKVPTFAVADDSESEDDVKGDEYPSSNEIDSDEDTINSSVVSEMTERSEIDEVKQMMLQMRREMETLRKENASLRVRSAAPMKEKPAVNRKKMRKQQVPAITQLKKIFNDVEFCGLFETESSGSGDSETGILTLKMEDDTLLISFKYKVVRLNTSVVPSIPEFAFFLGRGASIPLKHILRIASGSSCDNPFVGFPGDHHSICIEAPFARNVTEIVHYRRNYGKVLGEGGGYDFSSDHIPEVTDFRPLIGNFLNLVCNGMRNQTDFIRTRSRGRDDHRSHGSRDSGDNGHLSLERVHGVCMALVEILDVKVEKDTDTNEDVDIVKANVYRFSVKEEVYIKFGMVFGARSAQVIINYGSFEDYAAAFPRQAAACSATYRRHSPGSKS